ncbi:MAG: SDR family oxidoreductase [Candidatus Eiseniibacteriota bacterium]
MSGIFLTGATGFIGGRVLRCLTAKGREVVCLVRDPSRLPDPGPNVRVVRGMLEAPATYESTLRGIETVVHLAALTGKARAEEHARVNRVETARLLDRAKSAGVRRFLFVSTIAVKYPDRHAYPYAQAKEEAEALVRASGLDWAVVRPTAVLGPGSPLWDKFRALAAAPVMPVFGSGRNAVQPVHVDDVARCLADLAAGGPLGGRTLELGGRDTLSLEEFLRHIRRRIRGREGPAMHLPVGLIIRLLSWMEPMFFSVLPVTAGQFYFFAHDSSAEPAEGVSPPLSQRRGVDEIVLEHLELEAAAVPTDAVLDRECSVLCRHLIGAEPPDSVRHAYRAAHRPGAHGPMRSGDDVLTAVARRGPAFARLADAWAGVLARNGTLRRKLVLLLAILESTGETSAKVDAPDRGTSLGFVAGLVGRVMLFAATFAVSLVVVPLFGIVDRIAPRRGA